MLVPRVVYKSLGVLDERATVRCDAMGAIGGIPACPCPTWGFLDVRKPVLLDATGVS